MLEYTPDNLKLVNEVILNNLTPDLLLDDIEILV